MKIIKVNELDSKYLELLKLIDSGEYRIVTNGEQYGFKGYLERYIFESEDNYGIFTSMVYNDYLRFQISFKKDVDILLTEQIYQLIKNIMEKENKASDIWLNNENHLLVDHLLKLFKISLKDVYMSRELMYFNEPLKINNSPLREVPYSKNILMDTLNLLEDSFVEIAKPNDFITQQDYYHQKFSNQEKSRFCGFLLNQELIGMYFHHDGELEYIAVKSSEQSKGYGKIILHHALKSIKMDSANIPYLYCVDQNIRALSFYLREGFTMVAHAARL